MSIVKFSTLFKILSLAVCLTCVNSLAQAAEWDDLIGPSSYTGTYQNQQNNPATAPQNQPKFVNRLDQEILLLRAEMSKRNGDVRQVQRYLEQLSKQQILPPFRGRVEVLKQYVANNQSFFGFSKQHVQQIHFPMNDVNAVVAMVLPTSGDYEMAGLALQNALQDGLKAAGFKGKLIQLDSNIYGSAFELWELLKYYQPDFIFGPLRKEMVVSWKNLRTGVPTLFFNDLGYLGVGEFSLSPNRLAGLEQVFQILQQGQYENILVLTDDSEKAVELEVAFQQSWLNFNRPSSYHSHVIEGNVGQSIDQVMGVQGSKDRHRWMERVLNYSLEFEPRTRKDVEAVISFLPQELAIQVSPYLNFLSTSGDVTHIWYPSQTPKASYLAFNMNAWQQTFMILPQSVAISNGQEKGVIEPGLKTGLFHALGQVAVEIVKNSALSSSPDTLELTKHGAFVRNASGQFHLLPIVYWADDGTLEKFYQLTE